MILLHTFAATRAFREVRGGVTGGIEGRKQVFVDGHFCVCFGASVVEKGILEGAHAAG
jgi:hypothetical protein